MMSKKKHDDEPPMDDQPPPADSAQDPPPEGEPTVSVRKEYRVLSEEEKAKVDSIKDAGTKLLEAIQATGHNRHNSLAITRVEEAVMWAVKGLTG